jgi:putative flippase GtrA
MRRSDIRAQFGWYLVVGGSAFVVDIASFVAFQSFGMPLLVASSASFVVATVVNYVLSYRLAFSRGRFGRGAEVARLFAVAVVGLGFNTLLVWLFVDLAGITPVVAKVIAVPIVLVWNFLGRRIFVFRPELPEATYSLTQSVVDNIAGTHGDASDKPAADRQAP